MLMTEYEMAIFASILGTLPEILKAHPYGIGELAREFSQRLEKPLYEIMTPLAEALQALTKQGEIIYDRPHNWVLPAVRAGQMS